MFFRGLSSSSSVAVGADKLEFGIGGQAGHGKLRIDGFVGLGPCLANLIRLEVGGIQHLGRLELDVGLERNGHVAAHVVIDFLGPQNLHFERGLLIANLHVPGQVELHRLGGLALRRFDAGQGIARTIALVPDDDAVGFHVEENFPGERILDGDDDGRVDDGYKFAVGQPLLDGIEGLRPSRPDIDDAFRGRPGGLSRSIAGRVKRRNRGRRQTGHAGRIGRLRKSRHHGRRRVSGSRHDHKRHARLSAPHVG